MATSQQLMQLMNNPNARKMLDLIAAAEGVKYGYNTLFGNQRIDNLSAHPNIKKPFKQTDGQVKYTTAAGRYQFLKDTWDGLARQYGIKDFSPQSQDFGALALLAQNGALPYVLKGDFNTAIRKSGSTWASLPTSPYAQNKRSWDFINKTLGSNYQPESRYLNQEQIAKVLPQLA
ncbi:glycoside hydrolase family 24 protein, partial [Acinetobacter baumannii]